MLRQSITAAALCLAAACVSPNTPTTPQPAPEVVSLSDEMVFRHVIEIDPSLVEGRSFTDFNSTSGRLKRDDGAVIRWERVPGTTTEFTARLDDSVDFRSGISASALEEVRAVLGDEDVCRPVAADELAGPEPAFYIAAIECGDGISYLERMRPGDPDSSRPRLVRTDAEVLLVDLFPDIHGVAASLSLIIRSREDGRHYIVLGDWLRYKAQD